MLQLAVIRHGLLFIFLQILMSRLFAQEGMIRGHLRDTVGHQVLKGALIVVRRDRDSTVCARSFSKEDATFEISSLSFGDYIMQISFQGFEPVGRLVHLDREHAVWDVGELNLRIRISELDSVRVQEPPMLLKKDTLIYNSSRFATQPYAPVSDLLEELPGMRVNADGSMTVNGQIIDRLLVDGMPFFNGDPKMALQHLPAEIVRQIQVYPTSDERSALSGLPGSSSNKTLNLVIKSNRRHGDFGKIGAGAGPDGVYAATMDLNHLNGRQQIAVAGDGGNVDGLNASKPGEGVGAVGAGVFGVTRKWNGGLNYRDNWNDRTDVSGSYINNQRHIEDSRMTHTLTLFPGDSSTILDQKTSSVTSSSQQRLNLTVTDKLDASNSLSIRPTILLQHAEANSSGQSLQTNGQSGATIYQSVNDNTNNSNTKNASAELLYLHKGNGPSRSFSAGLSILSNHNQNNNFNSSRTDYMIPAATVSDFDQHVINKTSLVNVSPSVTYTVPVGRHDVIDIQSSYQYNDSKSLNQAFRFNGQTHQFDQADTSQSNNFNTIYNTTKLMADYRIQRIRYSILLGTGVESDQLKGRNLSNKSVVASQYLSFLPSADLSFHLGNGKEFHFSYNGMPVALTVQQLQPVTITADSLFIQQGNPRLKQPFTHNFSFSYTSIQTSTQRYFSAVVSGSTTIDAIQNSVTLLSNGAQLFKPVNMNGTTNVFADVNFTIPMLRQHSSIGLNGNIRYSQDPGLSNGLKADTRTMNLLGGVSWSIYAGSKISLSINAVSAYNILSYSQDINQSGNYFTESLSSKFTYTVRDWVASLVSYYAWNNSLTAGYQPKAPVFSPVVSRRLFHRKQGEVRLYVADLFNQQSGALRTVSSNTITDMSARTRGRYALLSFIYNLSRFKAGN
ncbi:MAG TPA: outer membrane beta-barrel protein [Puia sp.]|nr:outer membrane beta-barrel protein [Puia sp.]